MYGNNENEHKIIYIYIYIYIYECCTCYISGVSRGVFVCAGVHRLALFIFFIFFYFQYFFAQVCPEECLCAPGFTDWFDTLKTVLEGDPVLRGICTCM